MKASWKNASKWTRWSVVLRCIQSPHCTGVMSVFLSKYHTNRLLIIHSLTLQMNLNRETSLLVLLCLTIWEIRLLAVIASDARWKRFCLRRTETCSAFGVLRECAIQIYFYLLTYSNLNSCRCSLEHGQWPLLLMLTIFPLQNGTSSSMYITT